MIKEYLLATKEMIEGLHRDLKKETTVKIHLVTEEVIADLHQDLRKETIVEVHMVKKAANLLSLKKSLVVLKKNLLKNLLGNLQFNSNNFSSLNLNQ